MTDTTQEPVMVERVEMSKMAGRLIQVVEYLEKSAALRRIEDGNGQSPCTPPGLWALAENARAVRERLVELARTLPEGPLEAFGREHPLYDDPIDGPYCGYGARDGKPYTCPVRDPALHWDAWELLGTRLKRPERAARK